MYPAQRRPVCAPTSEDNIPCSKVSFEGVELNPTVLAWLHEKYSMHAGLFADSSHFICHEGFAASKASYIRKPKISAMRDLFSDMGFHGRNRRPAWH
jgi:hypothetical protein